MNKDFASLFDRDIKRVIEEIEAFGDDQILWSRQGSISNSPGNLALHIAGNLRHFIGHILGGNPYTRDRYFEFNGQVEKSKLIENLQEAKAELKDTFDALKEDALSKDYPIEVLGYPMSIAHFLIHLNGHLTYHLGQINYYRRLLEA
ncbi:MAG: DinB family protein [Bacteroidota bacterium]